MLSEAGTDPQAGERMGGVTKIVCGGQTGVDRAALDAARALGLATGGWVPEGRRDEAGRIPTRYAGLRETDSPDPAVRTRLNVADSDATLILTTAAAASPGTDWTRRCADELGKPHLTVRLADGRTNAAAARIRSWLAAMHPAVLNVAGPRASEAGDAYALARAVLLRALAPA